jgi:hypothetical protein
MAILGVWECVVVCMFDRDTLIANTIKRDLDEEMRIIQGCDDFWQNHVVPRIPPEPLGDTKALMDTLHRYTGDANKSAPGILLGSEYAELCKEYTDAYAKYKAASDVAKGYEAQYKKLAVPFAMAMGVSTQGTVIGPDGLKWLVKLTPKMSNASIDRQKLEALYPDAFKACDVPRRETSRTLTIKVVKK